MFYLSLAIAIVIFNANPVVALNTDSVLFKLVTYHPFCSKLTLSKIKDSFKDSFINNGFDIEAYEYRNLINIEPITISS